ncbi:HAD-IIB family hydrolase [Persicimonas caeni]|uniref:HAD-IIB family hydrolase n=1 Tax=Persicimonas caeni TaxID=2292766 RepID=UPI00143D10C3|nr:HAD-IIB family hydrolase [Persicimonas caeni]
MSLVLLDIDGTLLGADGGVDAAIWSAAERLRDAGLRLAVCTGRTHSGVALDIARRLDAGAPHIFHNGALVTTADAEPKLLHSAPLGADVLRRLVGHARRLEATIEFYTAGEVYVDRITTECARHAEVLDIAPVERDLEGVLIDEEVIRAHWIIDPALLDQALAVDLPACNASSATSPALPKDAFISVTSAHVSKGTGAVFAAEHLGVDLADVVGVGDSMSDIPMLDAVGHPFAMADGDPQVCERFRTCGPVDQNGVIEALEFALRRCGDLQPS